MKLWAHQSKAIDLLDSRPFNLLAMDMGTGKSRCIIEHVARMKLRDDRPLTILILCPKSVIGVWPKEFAKFYPGDVGSNGDPGEDVTMSDRMATPAKTSRCRFTSKARAPRS